MKLHMANRVIPSVGAYDNRKYPKLPLEPDELANSQNSAHSVNKYGDAFLSNHTGM